MGVDFDRGHARLSPFSPRSQVFTTSQHYKRFAAKALSAQGKTDEASRSPGAADWDINRICDETLLAGGRVDEAYRRYWLISNTASTYVGTLRAIGKKYPDKKANEILGVASSVRQALLEGCDVPLGALHSAAEVTVVLDDRDQIPD